MTDPDPRPIRAAATDRVEPVTARDIAAFTARLARLRSPALGGDPAAYAAEHAALLAHKAELFARIADQHAGTDPAHAGEAREIAERAHAAAQHTVDAHDTTNVKDLPSPSFPGWGISLSDSGEFRRASSYWAPPSDSASGSALGSRRISRLRAPPSGQPAGSRATQAQAWVRSPFAPGPWQRCSQPQRGTSPTSASAREVSPGWRETRKSQPTSST